MPRTTLGILCSEAKGHTDVCEQLPEQASELDSHRSTSLGSSQMV